MKKISKVVSFALTLSLLAGCAVPEGKERQVISKSKYWLDHNDFIVTENTNFSDEVFKNITKASEGTVFAEYKYFDTKHEGYFENSVKVEAQSEMLKLLVDTYDIYSDEDYLDKAVLIGDNLLEQIFQTEVAGQKVYLLKSAYYFNDSIGNWGKPINSAYTEDQLRTAYSLLRLYNITDKQKYLTAAEQLLHSQIRISSHIANGYKEGMLPYEYSILGFNSDKYNYSTIFPLFLSKACYEAFNLAYDITGNKDYEDFALKNNQWLLSVIDNATLKSGMVFGAVEYNENMKKIFVNRDDKDTWDKENDFMTEDMLETLLALSYIDTDKANKYLDIVLDMDIHEIALKDTVFNKLTSNGKKPISKLKGYYQDAYSTVLRLEYLKNMSIDEEDLHDKFRRVLGLVENTAYDDINSTGAVCRNYEYAKIDTFTTAYFLSFVTKYYKDK